MPPTLTSAALCVCFVTPQVIGSAAQPVLMLVSPDSPVRSDSLYALLQVRKIVAAAMQDILTPQELFKGIKMTLGTNEAAQIFEPDRSAGSSLDAKSIPKLTMMSHRVYEYDKEGKFKAIVLRQQTGLGSGLRVT